MKPYYYVYRLNNQGPRFQHPTLEAAHAEALRLAGQHPGESFEILQCLATVRTTTPQAFWMDGIHPPEPTPKMNSAADASPILALVRKWEAEGERCGEEARNSDEEFDDDGDQWRERRAVYFDCAEELEAALGKLTLPNT